MIVALADDLAGAAEVAGAALRYGLTAEIQVGPELQTEADLQSEVGLLAVNTDTRSSRPEEAARRVAALGRECRGRIFKKVDSVLRGQVVAELAGLLEERDESRALLVPANPSLGRTIEGGCYFVEGVPLHETSFAHDPEHPARSSDIGELLGPAESWPVRVLQAGSSMPERGILVGEATHCEDVTAWAEALDEATLPVGASEFFAAYLRAQGHVPVSGEAHEVGPVQRAGDLFVCGSTSSYSSSFIEECAARGVPVLRMPAGLFGGDATGVDLVDAWAEETATALGTHQRATVAIDRPLCLERGLPRILSARLGEVVTRVLERRAVGRLLVTGGATATALVERLGWKRLRVLRELATGVVCVRGGGRELPLMIVKPGSYAWPEQVWPHT